MTPAVAAIAGEASAAEARGEARAPAGEHDPAHPPTAEIGALRAIWRALMGETLDYTQGSLTRAILLLAVPMVLEMAMESAFALVDVFFVSRLGAGAVATVGLTESMLSLVYAVAIGLAMAVSATVARRIGEKDRAAATHAAVQGFYLAVAVALPIAICGGLFAPDLLRLMGAEPDVVRSGHTFTRIMLGGNVVIVLLFVLNGAFRGAGDPALAMRSLWLANGINLVLDPCLILGLWRFPKLGLTGAAVATTIGRGCGVAFQLWVLLSGRGRIAATAGSLGIDLRAVAKMVKISLGGMGQILISTVSWIALARILAPFGSAALAGYTVALRLVMVALLPAWGMANAAATLVGQNLGAQNPDRAERAVWQTALYNVIFLAAVSLTFLSAARPLLRFFTDDPDVLASGVACLRTLSYGYLFYAYGMVVVQSFNGAGDTTTPTAINIVCFWLVQTPLAYVLARHAGLGPRGVYWAITIANSSSAVIGVIAFRRGRWKLRRV